MSDFDSLMSLVCDHKEGYVKIHMTKIVERIEMAYDDERISEEEYYELMRQI